MNFFPPKTLELTLALIKPDAVANPYAINVIKRKIVDDKKFFVVRRTKTLLTKNKAARLYAVHIGKPFYTSLISFMTSGPCEAMILAKENAIQDWRQLMGPTKLLQAQFSEPDSIRGRFSLSGTKNAVHGSDSVASFNEEVPSFFDHFSSENWYAKDEIYFRNGYVKFDEDSFTHSIEKENNPF